MTSTRENRDRVRYCRLRTPPPALVTFRQSSTPIHSILDTRHSLKGLCHLVRNTYTDFTDESHVNNVLKIPTDTNRCPEELTEELAETTRPNTKQNHTMKRLQGRCQQRRQQRGRRTATKLNATAVLTPQAQTIEHARRHISSSRPNQGRDCIPSASALTSKYLGHFFLSNHQPILYRSSFFIPLIFLFSDHLHPI